MMASVDPQAASLIGQPASRIAPDTRVFLVRHGLSTFNAQRRYQGRHDESILTEEGEAMARQVGEALAAVRFDRIVTSPLQRARQTAALIAASLATPALPVEEHPALREVDIPEWEGWAHADVQSRFPERFREWIERPETFRMERHSAAGSTPFFPLRELHDDAAALWTELLLASRAGPEPQTVLLVTHGGTVRALLSAAVGAPVAHHHCAGKANCAVTEILIDGRGRSRLLRVNDTGPRGIAVPAAKAHGARVVLCPIGASSTAPALPAEITADSWVCDPLAAAVAPASATLPASREALLAVLRSALARRPPNHLHTTVVVAPAAHLQPFVAGVLGATDGLDGTPWLIPGRLSVVDQEPDQPRPILRALNLTPPAA